MNLAAGLPWITPGSAGFPIEKINGISGPVNVPQEKSPAVIQQRTSTSDDVIPGVPPISTTTVKGKISDMWQALAAQFVMNGMSSKSGEGSGLADLIKTPWDAKDAPKISSAQGGKSGDITGGVNYGDIVAKGLKFDLTSVPSWFWLVAALSSGAGLLFLMKSSKKGKK